MTVEERVLINLSDILALEFTCKRCGVKIAISPQKERHFLPSKCASCETSFAGQRAIDTLMTNLHHVLRDSGITMEDAPFTLQIVVDTKVKKPTD